jgi:hypothetical protein
MGMAAWAMGVVVVMSSHPLHSTRPTVRRSVGQTCL